MKILISGITGFVGEHLIRALEEKEYQICALVRKDTDIRQVKNSANIYVFDGDIEKFMAYAKEQQFDGVIHLASLFLKEHTTYNIPNLLESNIQIGTLLLEAAKENQIKWFINTGTFWQHFQGEEYSPVNLYAATKQAFESIAKYYIETSNINFVSILLNDTFGPEDKRAKIFKLWFDMIASGRSLEMSGGEQMMDILYIDDVINAYVHLIGLLIADVEKNLCGKRFALHAKERISLRGLARIFEHTTGSKLDIHWGVKDYKKREVMVPWGGGDRLLGWEPQISITEGIQKIFHITNL